MITNPMEEQKHSKHKSSRILHADKKHSYKNQMRDIRRLLKKVGDDGEKRHSLEQKLKELEYFVGFSVWLSN